MAKLDVRALGMSLGILWAVVLFLWTLAATVTGYGASVLDLLGTIYPGYSVTVVGAWIGLIYAFFDGLFGGMLIAWLYNRLVR